MPTRVKVNVTPQLVERATQRDSRHCMIAEAIKEAHPDYKSILVDLATIRWTNPRTRKRYVCLTPPIAGQALVDFDQGREVEPFSFTVTPIQATPIVTREVGPDGRVHERTSRSRSYKNGTIIGGDPLPIGHLGGTSNVHQANAAAKREARRVAEAAQLAESSGTESNVQLSSSRYRQYGRRLLKG